MIFLITDGYSNGGDPRPVAASLREFGVEIFTFGIWQGNIRELNDMASHPKEEHCYLLHSFAEFEALARRALHEGNLIYFPVSFPIKQNALDSPWTAFVAVELSILSLLNYFAYF